jgi:hypothetical protein
MSNIVNILVGLLIFAAMILCVALLVLVIQYIVETAKNMHDYDTDKVTKNHSIRRRRVMDKYDILAILVGMESGI